MKQVWVLLQCRKTAGKLGRTPTVSQPARDLTRLAEHQTTFGSAWMLHGWQEENSCETSSCTAVDSRPGSKTVVSVQTLLLLISSSEAFCQWFTCSKSVAWALQE